MRLLLIITAFYCLHMTATAKIISNTAGVRLAEGYDKGISLQSDSSYSQALSGNKERIFQPNALVNINPGDEITIRANTTTTVVCASGKAAPACKNMIEMYESRYKTCKQSYSASTCYNNEWQAFKTRHPECVHEAFDACFRTCEESYASSSCYNNCR